MGLFHIVGDKHQPKRIFKRDQYGCVVWFSPDNSMRTYCYGNGRDFPDDAVEWPDDTDSA